MNKSQIKKYWNMVWEMSLMDFKQRDQGTLFGFFWTLIHPLVYFIVLYGLFKKWMGHHVSNFPLYLIIGIVQWGFFATATSNSIQAVKRGGNFVKSINFPKTILVYSSVASILFSHLMEVFILMVFLIIVGQPLGLTIFYIPIVVILNIFLVTGVSFFLASVGVFFLDIQRIWGIFTSVGLFLTPIFYSLELLDPVKRKIILLNPMAHIIQGTRDILIDNTVPDFKSLSYVFIVSLIIMAIGYNLYKRYDGLFAEHV